MESLNQLIFGFAFPWNLLLICGILLCFCVATLKIHALNVSGIFGAFAVGLGVLWSLRLEGFFMLLFFFASAGVLGKLSKKHKNKKLEKKEGARDIVQVFANGFFALLGAVGWMMSSNIQFLVIFAAGLAEANADTWAGEIGRFSRRGPVSIRTLLPVEKGISGGVTVLGTVGGLLGSLFEALLLGLLFPFKDIWLYAGMIALSGFVGSFIDSLLGAFVQVQYFNPATGRVTERETDESGNKLEISQGLRWVDNDMVNFMSNVFSVVLALGLTAWI